MRIFTLFLAAIAFSLSAMAEPVRIMPLGDSLTAQGEARAALAEHLRAGGFSYEFVGSQGTAPLLHEGHSGFTIGPDQSRPGNLSDHLEEWVKAARPNVILLLVGNNDYNGKAGVDPATAPERLKALLTRLVELAPNATIIVGSVLKIAWKEDYAGALNRTIQDTVAELRAKGHQVLFADLNREVDLVKGAPPFTNPGGDYVDGTHLNAQGARKLADAWYAHLQPVLAAASHE